MAKNKALQIQKLINNAKKVAIVMHSNPDGDAMGSALALCEYVQTQKKEVTVISPTPIASDLLWLPQASDILTFEKESAKHKAEMTTFDTVIFVDHSNDTRSEPAFEYLTAPATHRAFIDHHPSPNMDVAIAYSVVDSASTCCLIYEIFKEWNIPISATMATSIFTGIMTDTGNFHYGSNMSQVFRIASELMLLGIDKEYITQKVYHTATENRMRLMGYVLKDKMTLVNKNSAYITLTMEEFHQFNATKSDTENLVNLPLFIENVTVSAIFIENPDFIKISLRSRGEFDVNLLARTHFNGGGHRNASGGTFLGSMQTAVDLFIENTRN